MIRRATGIAAAALATAALVPWPAGADGLAEAERRAASAEQRLADVERLGAGPEEAPALRAARRFEEGEAQHRLGDWFHAGVLLAGALDEPAFRDARQHAEAVFLLADALRRQGACGAARARYAEYLALGASERRPAAVSGALECAVKERRSGDVDALLAESERTFGADVPAEVRYLAAKALFQRTDLPSKERLDRAAAAFEMVGPPFQLQAWYFLGVIQIERQNLHGSLQWFEACARSEPAAESPGSRPAVRSRQDPEVAKHAELRELCMLALGRVHSQMGDAAAALDWYRAIPWESPRFDEALYELAWSFVKGQQYERALRTASFIAELAPDSPLAPEATVLEGHLLLRLGRYSEATDAYNHVINTYAPVRDELDAILATQEDPVRYFNELVGRQGKALDVSAVLPPVALKWASTKQEVAAALELVQSLDDARHDLQDAQDAASRMDALLARGAGIDAFPGLRRAYASAQAVENDVAMIEGDLVGALSAAAAPALTGEARAALERARTVRAALEPRVRALPRTHEAAEERLARMRGRLDQVDREAYQTGFLVEELDRSISGTEAWIEDHRAEIDADPEGRRDLAEELRKHRDVVAGYLAELRGLRQDVARARDLAGGADALTEESRLRAEYLAAVDVERAAAEAARGSVAPPERAAFERGDQIRERLAAMRTRARALKLGLASDAGRRAGEMKDRVAAERAALAGDVAALDAVQASAKTLVGGIAYRSFNEVRAQFYRIVLKADVGIVDVAWSRKRQRLEKIQQLSIQKANEVEELDREYRAMLREEE